MTGKTVKKELAILSMLRSSDLPLSGAKITEEMNGLGYDISERTVRYYLKRLDENGLTKPIGKKGRIITNTGLREIESAHIIERVNFFSARIDRMTYLMDFDVNATSGTVVVNITLANAEDVRQRSGLISQVYACGYAMGNFLSILAPGQRIGHIVVPEDTIGIATVCSITLNGVLLKYGVPTYSRFGGLLELQNGVSTRFVEIIHYEGTSIDPLEVFIRSGMTDYVGAVSTGNGRIGASFREFPTESREVVEELAGKLSSVGLGAFTQIGRPSQPLLDIPVSEGRIGAIVIGGLNPMAILEETGLRVYTRAMAGLVEFGQLFHFSEMEDRIKAYL